MPVNLNNKSGVGNNRATQPRDLRSHPVFEQPGMKEHHMKNEDMMKMMHDDMGSAFDMLMGASATSIMAYAAPLAAAIAVAAF